MAVALPFAVPSADTPIRATPLPFHRVSLTEEECAAVLRVLRSGWLTTGQESAAFEAELAAYLDVPHAATLNSCTAGLHLGLLVAGIGPGDVVITTPFTFCASVNVIEHVGALPLLVDVDPRDGCLSLEALEALPVAKGRQRCVLPVHYAGNPVDMPRLVEWAGQRDAVILSDAAHALETRIQGRSMASWSDLSAYSFYATKNVTTGEGGCLTAIRPDWNERIRTLRLHGMSADALRRYEPGAPPTYDVTEPGFKYNLPDPAAALGRLQLAAVETHWIRRAELVARYRALFAPLLDSGAIRLLIPDPATQTTSNRSAYHLCPLVINPNAWKIDRNAVIARLNAEGISTSIHFTPVHQFSYYAKRYGFTPDAFPVAASLGANEISLPLHPWLTDDEVEQVCAAILKVWATL
ncbi:MAG: DegT/DnrJ/EryC1/StrS family aminotransferase [bacterium]